MIGNLITDIFSIPKYIVYKFALVNGILLKGFLTGFGFANIYSLSHIEFSTILFTSDVRNKYTAPC